jgi:hypothetical protein
MFLFVKNTNTIVTILNHKTVRELIHEKMCYLPSKQLGCLSKHGRSRIISVVQNGASHLRFADVGLAGHVRCSTAMIYSTGKSSVF